MLYPLSYEGGMGKTARQTGVRLPHAGLGLAAKFRPKGEARRLSVLRTFVPLSTRR
jgi:hypothetical protein